MQPSRSIDEWTEQIRRDVSEHRVFLYVKGEKGAPACGYSHRAMLVFERLGVPYEVRNVLADPQLLDALCTFTNWPTTPQVFLDGRFVGGCDIVTEMFSSGELHRALGLPLTAHPRQ